MPSMKKLKEKTLKNIYEESTKDSLFIQNNPMLEHIKHNWNLILKKLLGKDNHLKR